MLGKTAAVSDDKKGIYVEFAEPIKFKMGDEVVVNHSKKIRTNQQNSLYWVMLEWCIHPDGGGLCRQGRLSKDGLHEDIKAYMEERHGNDFKVDKKFTTTTLDRYQFGVFFDMVNLEIMIEYFRLDMTPFWKDYEKFSGWQKTNPGGMDDYLRERVPF